MRSLMAQAMDGDRQAYVRLLDELYRFLRGYFRRRLGRLTPDVEDLAQEVMLAVHLNRAAYDPARLFTPWVCAIARHKLLDHLRRDRRRFEELDEDLAEGCVGPWQTAPGEIRVELDWLLARLGPRDRRLIEETKLLGASIRSAAAAHGMSEVAARVAVHRSLKSLQRVAAA